MGRNFSIEFMTAEPRIETTKTGRKTVFEGRFAGFWGTTLVAGLALLHGACASSVPIPDRVQARTESYVAVPQPPPPPRPEHVPDKPRSGAVWVDGEWQWDGSRYTWNHGVWVLPPRGAKISTWTMRRREDGQLFFAPSVWYDAQGHVMPEPTPLAEGSVREIDASAPPSSTLTTKIDAGPEDAGSTLSAEGGPAVAPLDASAVMPEMPAPASVPQTDSGAPGATK